MKKEMWLAEAEMVGREALLGKVVYIKDFSMIFLLGIWFCFSLSMADLGPNIIQNNLIEFTMTNGIGNKAGSRTPRQASPFPRRETKPQLTEFSVKSTIISRYAFTAVSCTMVNRAADAKDTVFQMQIPAAAFVSNFTMIIGGRTYHSHVTWKKEKTGENNIYDSTRIYGEHEMETFKASAVIPGRNKAVFLLMYEELLQRRLGMYEHAISVRPQQLVGRLMVEVNIVENSGITSLEVPPFQNTKQKAKTTDTIPSPPPSTVINQTENFARITFNPNVILQAKIAQKGTFGDFVVRYDVKRELSVGDLQVLNGYFVHYFAPTDLPPLPKNIVFVIDTSASMVGTKIKQTKEALFTILQDLRPDDHFNIIGFSTRIKVWHQDKMVKVTPNNIRDAKKFIYGLSPTGGTDINGGIRTGANLLNNYLSQNGWHERSVSLIVFLTDGRPTVGEVQSTNIIGNTKSAIKEKFCLFSIGIGNDVDYNLLEKLSLENCGMMRRIHEDEDAAVQLKGFYDEIGTPLLSDIRITYPPDSVEYVTQNMFYNYFNGSEIVVAGKLLNRSSNTLHVKIKASNSNKYVVLEDDINIEGVVQNEVTGSELIAENPEYRNHVERLWGYLTFKELLTAWHKTDDGKEKEEIMANARKLALNYNFVTPFTLLEVKDSGFQADLPKEEATSLHTEGIGQKLLNLQGKKAPDDSPPKNQGKQKTSVSKTSADGDPHFVVDFPLSKVTVCFNIDGEPGDILRLVSDHKNSGVTVNGQLIGAPAPLNGHKKQRTYFSSITIIINKPKRSYIEITPAKVILDSKDRLILSCYKTATVKSDDLVVFVNAKSNVTVTIRGTISFVILVHHYKNPAPYQRNHLGFYISNSKGLSSNSHGLLGQFIYNEVKVTTAPLSTNNKAAGKPAPAQNVTMLTVRNRKIPVIRKQRKLYNGLHQVDCWFVKNNAAKLIDGTYQDYLVSHPFESGNDLITNEV
ncbi:inter-alpha-trypsin inhibitor heavy chain H5 [Spea bombifrons]|uniref:inter-alpha-trypsin inhibitor heavy chain H5 n=1 Tax=Spea bombifrons TaxID=233779 RepID=UPI00234A63BE|nr:inter-alpha-trypsin inhibitor heavy chain H5 [Spea bombifrons]